MSGLALLFTPEVGTRDQAGLETVCEQHRRRGFRSDGNGHGKEQGYLSVGQVRGDAGRGIGEIITGIGAGTIGRGDRRPTIPRGAHPGERSGLSGDCLAVCAEIGQRGHGRYQRSGFLGTRKEQGLVRAGSGCGKRSDRKREADGS